MSDGDAGGKTFSASWHRVAAVKASLRPNVRAHRQAFRGVAWFVLQDPLNNQFFRVTADAYGFLCRLGNGRSVDEAWQETLAGDPDAALSQEEVVQLLGHLNMANLLHFDTPSAAPSIFDRYRQRVQRETRAKWMGFLSIRIPLLDPDRWLERLAPLIRVVYGPVGLVLWLALLLMGAKVAVDHRDTLFDQAGDLLAPGNLLLLYAGFLIAKVIHELSHAMACKRFGGEVHALGVMLVVFTPMPYVDASSSWGFRRRWQRMLVGAAGILAEFAVGAVAVLVWAWSAPGPVHAVAYNVMFVATVSTFLFNMNPLLRFDGYYILTDLLEAPNLYQRSREQLKYLFQRYLFGVDSLRPPSQVPTEGGMLALYGVLSLLYWVVVISGIVLFVADQYLDLGVLIALFLLLTLVLIPLGKFIHYLLFSPRLAPRRGRAWLVLAGMCAALFAFLGLVPMPDRVRAPGVVEAMTFREMNSETAGFIVELLVRPGQPVAAGQALVRLGTPDLAQEIHAAEMQLLQSRALERRAEGEMVADLAPLRQQRAALESSLSELRRRRGSLVVTAPIAGIWSAPEIEDSVGKWIPRGTSLGTLVDQSAYRFVAVLPQVATYLFGDTISRAEVRLAGQENINLPAESVQVIPFQHGVLPSPALGWAGGGDIAVASNDPGGVTATEPFFLIYAHFPAAGPSQAMLLHGRSGTLRITLADQPLLLQWERAARQFLQQRYRL